MRDRYVTCVLLVLRQVFLRQAYDARPRPRLNLSQDLSVKFMTCFLSSTADRTDRRAVGLLAIMCTVD